MNEVLMRDTGTYPSRLPLDPGIPFQSGYQYISVEVDEQFQQS